MSRRRRSGSTLEAISSDVSGRCWNGPVTDQVIDATEYRVIAWWTHPGEPLPGGVQLPDGWGRSFDVASFADPNDVASFLKSHPDAWNADVVTYETGGGQRVSTHRHAAERTIAGWLMSEAKLEQVPPELPDHLCE